MTNRAGEFITNLSGDAAYKSFSPVPLPPQPPVELDAETVGLLVQANKALAQLESQTGHIPSMPLFISMYVRKEALMSSQIEGTQAMLEDILDPMRDENANRNVAEVVNYVKATEFAVARQKELPLSNRLIREVHAVSGLRGQEKDPGEFRRSQNWIGGQGNTLKNARYIPPNPQDMAQAMSDLEKYLYNEDNLDVLVQAALIHYQFETIHPFLDGNGRVGRLLITLFLLHRQVLSSPALYISYSLKKNRTEYYDRLMEVREKGHYEQWVKFFLLAVLESAQDAVDTVCALNLLHGQNTAIIKEFGRASMTALRLLDYLEANPIIEIAKTAAALNMTFTAVSNAVNRLVDAGVLAQTAGKQRYRTFSYAAYLEILRSGT